MIKINNLTTNPVDEEFLKKVAMKVLEDENKKESDLSLAVVGQGRMKKLNKKYRGKNRVTELLIFPEARVLLEKFKAGSVQKAPGLGQIIICVREIKKNAKRFDLSFEKELARVLIHGILDLLGYSYELSERKAKYLKEKQEYYLSQLSSL